MSDTDPRPAWDQLFETLDAELEALEGDQPADDPLRCRLALLRWDLRQDAAGSRALLEPIAKRHPLAAALLYQLLLDDDQGEEAATLLEQLAEIESDDAVPLLARAAALRLLWTLDAPAALQTCRHLLDRGAASAEARLLFQLALLIVAEREELATRALAGEIVELPLLAAVAVDLWDWLGRPDDALDLLQRARQLDDDDPLVLELLLEAAVRLPHRIARDEILARKFALLRQHVPAAPETRAVAIALARIHVDQGDIAQSEELARFLLEDHDDAEATDPSGLRLVQLLLANLHRDIGIRTGDYRVLSQAYLDLSKASDLPPLARTYRLRRAQTMEHADFDPTAIAAEVEQNLEESPSDQHSWLMLLRLRLQHQQPSDLLEQLQQGAADGPEAWRRPLLRWAALVAEKHRDDLLAAASLQREGQPLARDPTATADLHRLLRASRSVPRLIDAYRREAEEAGHGDRAAMLWTAAAALQLDQQDFAAAEASAQQALASASEDLATLQLLAVLYRATDDKGNLRHVLECQLDLLRAPNTRAACLRELAALTDDPRATRLLLEQALAQVDDDAVVLRSLGELHQHQGDFDQAVELLRQAAAAEGDPQRTVELLLAVARLAEEQLGATDRAIAACREALEHAPDGVDVLELLARLQRKAGDQDGLIQTLRRQIEVTEEPHDRARLQVEVATAVDELGADATAVIDDLLAALVLDPDNSEAIAALEKTCQNETHWERLTEALVELPSSARLLELRARGLQYLDELEPLAQVRKRQLEMSDSDGDYADRAYDLGRISEQLSQIDDAFAWYRRALETDPKHRPSLRALQRLNEASGDLVALADLLRQELDTPIGTDRRIELVLSLARCSELAGDTAAAAAHLEEILELQPDHAQALSQLQQIYALNRPLDLARLLRHHAEIEQDPQQKSELFGRAAELLVAHGEEDAAAVSFQQAVQAHPGNRAAFTAFEAFAYQRQLWREVLEMYDRAIAYVEQGKGRSYRLAELYCRRGGLQLRHLGQPGEAAASYLKALERDPKSESTMNMLKQIFNFQQDWLGLISAYEYRASLMPDNELFRLESLRQAARVASRRLPPDSPDTLRLWSEIHGADPVDDEAADHLEALLELHEQWGPLADLLETRLALTSDEDDAVTRRRRLARLAAEQLEDPGRAAEAYEGIRLLRPHDESTLRELARIYEATARWEQCIEVLKDLVLIEADSEERSLLYFKCGSISEARFANDEEALHYYRLSLEQSAGCLPAIHGLRDLHLRREEWNEAISTLEHEIRLWDGEHEQAGVLARIAEIRLNHLHDQAKAIEEFEDALALDATCRPALIALFDLYFEREDWEKAQGIAERLAPRLAKEGDPKLRSRLFFRRGQLLARDEQTLAAAAESIVVSLRIWPDNLEALEFFVSLCRRHPEAHDYAIPFRELEQSYRRDGNTLALGHVLVAAGLLSEFAGDAETAIERYREAIEAAPSSLAPVRACADLLLGLRRTREAIDLWQELIERLDDQQTRYRAQLALGDIWANVVMDAKEAASIYGNLDDGETDRAEAGWRLAQELRLLGRVDEARRTMERVLKQAAARSTPPSELARYHHYLGAILAERDQEGARRCFRRALQLDPTCWEAALALVSALRRQGETQPAADLLVHTTHEVSRLNDPTALVALRRAHNELLRGSHGRQEALRGYRALVSDGLAQVEDHLRIAEILAEDQRDVQPAIDELQQVLESDKLNPHALSLLGELYARKQPDRAGQVLQVTQLLGLSDGAPLPLDEQATWKPIRALDERLRGLLAPEMLDPFVERLWRLCREAIERVFPLELPANKPQPADELGSAEFRLLVARCLRLCARETAIVVVDDLPLSIIADESNDRIVLDRALLDRPASEGAFAIGRMLELLRTGHALISRLAFDDRLLLLELLSGLLLPAGERTDLAEEFLRRLPRKVIDRIDALALEQAELLALGQEQLPARWLATVEQQASQFGLLASGDIAAALRMMAALTGQELALGPDDSVAVQAMAEGPELVRFFLSDAYLEVRRRLS